MKIKGTIYKTEVDLFPRYSVLSCGADEVGRGALAGPVVTSCVVLPPALSLTLPHKLMLPVRIDDSKKLTSSERNMSYEWIMKNALNVSVGIGSVNKINKKGIVLATNFAFRSAIVNANRAMRGDIQFVLIDAFYVPRVRGIPMSRQLPIIRGDSQEMSIAAASIVAKVTRDRILEKLALNASHAMYGWETNKGYGTKNHVMAMRKFGTTRHHRKMFAETALKRM